VSGGNNRETLEMLARREFLTQPHMDFDFMALFRYA
jgi:hypothetical protein